MKAYYLLHNDVRVDTPICVVNIETQAEVSRKYYTYDKSEIDYAKSRLSKAYPFLTYMIVEFDSYEGDK